MCVDYRDNLKQKNWNNSIVNTYMLLHRVQIDILLNVIIS